LKQFLKAGKLIEEYVLDNMKKLLNTL